MSSINDVMDEERNAERLLRDAQQRAEALLGQARASAAEMVKTAQSDDTLVRELTNRSKDRIAALRATILAECQARVAQTEELCNRNLEAAVRLITDEVLGVELEQRSA